MKSAKTWTRPSLADATVPVSVWDVWGCQSVFAKQNRRTDALWGWSLFANWRLERRWLRSKFEMSIHRPVCFILRTPNFELSVHFTWYNCTSHLFRQSKHKAVVHLSSLSTWYSQADPGLGPHTTRAIPRRQAEALHRRCLMGREVHLGAQQPHTRTTWRCSCGRSVGGPRDGWCQDIFRARWMHLKRHQQLGLILVF